MSPKILQVNFKLKASTQEYQALCQSVAQAVADVPGLCWKIWMLNDSQKEAGGIYLFEDEQALRDYLSGPIVAGVKSHPQLSDFSVKTFDAMEEVTARTRGPIGIAATAL